MAKRAFLFIMVLFLVVIVLLFIQWHMFQAGQWSERQVNAVLPHYKLTITHNKSDNLLIEQSIHRLDQQTYSLVIPKHIRNVTCVDDLGTKCQISGKKVVLQPNSKGINLTYTLPISSGRSLFLLKNWYVLLLSEAGSGIIKADYSVSVSEHDQSITWGAGAVQKAVIPGENLNYFAWENSQATSFPLFMTKERLRQTLIKEKVRIYRSQAIEEQLSTQVLKLIPSQTGLTLLYQSEQENVAAPLLTIVSPGLGQAQVEESLVQSLLLSNVPPNEASLRWLWAAFPSLILNRPTGTDKALQIAKQLMANLSEEEVRQFGHWFLENDNQSASATKLDQQLTDIVQKKTTFFSDNRDQQKPLKPLYFVDKRDIFITNNVKPVEWKSLYMKGEQLLPLKNIAQAFGLDMVAILQNNVYLLSDRSNSWRLYVGEAYFIHNGDNNGLAARPLKNINGQPYITKQFLEEVLNIKLTTKEDYFKLNN